MSTLRILALLALCSPLLAGCGAKGVQADREAAYLAYEQQDYANAAEQFARLVEETPRDADLWFRLGNAYGRTRQPEKAAFAYENALLRNPSMAKAWYNLGIIHLQQSLKAFVDMAAYVEADDPIGRRGEIMREALFQLLEDPPAETGEHERR